MKCWGDNGNGQLGNGTTVGASMPVEVVGVFGATAVAAGRSRLTGTVPFGGDHTCAIVVGGRVKCWGDNTFGQLGNGTTGQVNPEAVDVIGVSGATTLASGARHTCVIVGGGAIKCWGNNSHGQLGNGTTSPASLTAVDVIGIASASALAAGSEHTCAISVGGGVKCWGANDKGQLGDGTTTDSSIAVNATGIHGATALAAGNGHSCAIGVGGAIKCWGYNGYGQIGNGTSVTATTAVGVAGMSGANVVAACYWHTRAIVSGGRLKCWGYNGYGQLGNGTTSSITYGPVDAIGVDGAIAVTGGLAHTCAIVSGGLVKCWGWNAAGQLGDGTRTDTTTAVSVNGVSGATTLVAGGGHTCALVSGGRVKCWGSNSEGQLGDGSLLTTGTTPVDVSGVFGATALAAGGAHTCALVNGGRVKCWGLNLYGQLGNGVVSEANPTPVDVIGVSGASAVQAGGSQTCIVGGGGVKCWGQNDWGQLGNGTTMDSSIAVDTTGVSGATALAVGEGHACVVVGGGIECWGANGSGQLGNGTTVDAHMAVAAVAVSGAAALAAGGLHTCAIVDGGAVKCWGANHNGQLGDGGAEYFTMPTAVVIQGQSAIATEVPTLSLPAIAALIGVLSLTGIFRLQGCHQCRGDDRARLRS